MTVTGYDRRATRLLQRALNALDRGAGPAQRLALDGLPGPRTRAALGRHLRARGRAGVAALLRALDALH
jgi:hypothetical protein